MGIAAVYYQTNAVAEKHVAAHQAHAVEMSAVLLQAHAAMVTNAAHLQVHVAAILVVGKITNAVDLGAARKELNAQITEIASVKGAPSRLTSLFWCC